MFNMPGGPELLVIFLVALVVIGPQQLPKAMRTFGNVMAEVRKVSSTFQAEMKSAMDSVVDTSATEKPQSGSMAAATPATPAEPRATTVSDDPDEVVARTPVDPAADAAPDSSVPTEPDAPAAPAVDPADRAAG